MMTGNCFMQKQIGFGCGVFCWIHNRDIKDSWPGAISCTCKILSGRCCGPERLRLSYFKWCFGKPCKIFWHEWLYSFFYRTVRIQHLICCFIRLKFWIVAHIIKEDLQIAVESYSAFHFFHLCADSLYL